LSIANILNNLEFRKESYYEWLYDLAWTKRLLLALQEHYFQAPNKILTLVQLSIR